MFDDYNIDLFKEISSKMQEIESLEDFAREKNIDMLEDIMCLNPDHHDHSPSCHVSWHKNMYKCFACGDGGGYLKFTWRYAQKYEGCKLSIFAYLEKLLNTRKDMQRKYGTTTLKQQIVIDKNYLNYLEEIRLKQREGRRNLAYAVNYDEKLLEEMLGERTIQYDLLRNLNREKDIYKKLDILASIQKS